MAWISLIFLTTLLQAAELPRFLTKHSIDSLKYISMDGRYAYVEKRPGVLGLVSSFRSVDFLSTKESSDFIVTDSRHKQRLAIEVVPNLHTVYSLTKNHDIFVVDWGGSKAQEVGKGRAPRLHLQDEWISYYDIVSKTIHLQNIITQKKYEIRPSSKNNSFYIPEVEMVSSDTVVYSDVNEKGMSAVVSFNLNTQKGTIIYKSAQSGTRIELCQHKGYLAFGEFPYEGVSRGSQIMQIKLTGSTNLAGHATIYDSVGQDLGNLVCQEDAIFFVKTVGQDKALTIKKTEAARLDLKTQVVQIKSNINTVSHLINMDGRILIPHRGDFLVVEGKSNLGDDTLKAVPSAKEELPLEI